MLFSDKNVDMKALVSISGEIALLNWDHGSESYSASDLLRSLMQVKILRSHPRLLRLHPVDQILGEGGETADLEFKRFFSLFLCTLKFEDQGCRPRHTAHCW